MRSAFLPVFADCTDGLTFYILSALGRPLHIFLTLLQCIKRLKLFRVHTNTESICTRTIGFADKFHPSASDRRTNRSRRFSPAQCILIPITHAVASVNTMKLGVRECIILPVPWVGGNFLLYPLQPLCLSV